MRDFSSFDFNLEFLNVSDYYADLSLRLAFRDHYYVTARDMIIMIQMKNYDKALRWIKRS